MRSSGWESYVESFRTTTLHFAGEGKALIDEPGIVGIAGTSDRRNGRLLILDDRALPRLRELGDPYANMINVVPAAQGCIAHLNALGEYVAEQVTAMVMDDLAGLARPALDPALSLRRATRGAAAGEIELERAAAAVIAADPAASTLPLPGFLSYLLSVPNAEYLVAVDSGGEVRATAAAAVFGEEVRVYFVSTDRAWRGRGVGTAMTAAALLSARDRGAARAGLDASDAGRGIYLQLGFEEVGHVVMFGKLA